MAGLFILARGEQSENRDGAELLYYDSNLLCE